MERMHHAGRHHVQPAVGHGDPAALEIVGQPRGEGPGVRIEPARQAGEHRRHQMQAIERAVRGVAAEVVLGRPLAPRRVRCGERLAFVEERTVEARAIRPQRGAIKKCRKQGFDRHSVIIREARPTCYAFGMLTDRQIEDYRRDGYLVIPRLIEGEQLAELRALTDRIVAEARGVAANDELYDLEPSHTAALPRVRRLKPAIFKRYAFFHALVREPRIVAILQQLLGPVGPPVRRQAQHEIGVLRLAGRMAPGLGVYPHTNDDVLATGIYLDDCDPDNGPLLVLPGTHHGPTWIITPTAASAAP